MARLLKPCCVGRKVTVDDFLWPWRIRRWYHYHCKPQVLLCGFSSHWLLSMLVSHHAVGNSWGGVAQGCWDHVISWMSRLRSFQGAANTTEGWVSWSYLHFVEQLSSIGSVYSFSEILLIFVDKMNKKSFVSVYIWCLYNVFSIVWEDMLLRRSVMIHYIDIESSFHHICSFVHLFRYFYLLLLK